MTKKLNYYELLEIYPAATQEEIENAFRLALYKYHPDHNPDKPEWAHERTAEVVEAYKILSDPIKRKIYNFQILAPLKETIEEHKFSIFQIGEKKKFEDALKDFKEGVELYTTNKANSLLKFQQSYATYKLHESIYNMGVIYASANKLQEALHAFKEAERIAPENNHYKRVVERFQELMRDIDRARKTGY